MCERDKSTSLLAKFNASCCNEPARRCCSVQEMAFRLLHPKPWIVPARLLPHRSFDMALCTPNGPLGEGATAESRSNIDRYHSSCRSRVQGVWTWQLTAMCNLYNPNASARDIGAVFDVIDASGWPLEPDRKLS